MSYFNKLLQKADLKCCALAMLPPCLFRLLALSLSWEIMSGGTSCLVYLLCQPSSSLCCSSSVQKAPDTFTSSWMRKSKQRKVRLWVPFFLLIVLELLANENQYAWMVICEIGTSAFQMKSVIMCKKNVHDHFNMNAVCHFIPIIHSHPNGTTTCRVLDSARHF